MERKKQNYIKIRIRCCHFQAAFMEDIKLSETSQATYKNHPNQQNKMLSLP